MAKTLTKVGEWWGFRELVPKNISFMEFKTPNLSRLQSFIQSFTLSYLLESGWLPPQFYQFVVNDLQFLMAENPKRL